MANIGSYPLNEIITGDSRLLAQSIPDESIDLIFTDPVYENIEDYAWLAEVSQRILKPTGHLLAWQSAKYIDVTIKAIKHLNYRRQLIWYQSNNRGNDGKVLPLYVPCLWYSKSMSYPVKAFQDLRNQPFRNNGFFEWSKEPAVIAYWMSAFTREGELVYDPFSGMGTVAVVCKEMERNFIANEINPERNELARNRLLHSKQALGLWRSLTPHALDGGESAPFQAVFPPEVLSTSQTLPKPARRK